MRRFAAIGYASALAYAGVVLSVAVAQGASIGDILQNPTLYNGKHVVVAGIVSRVQQHRAPSGHLYKVFQLCNDSCIQVVSVGHPGMADGSTLTVRGKFYAASGSAVGTGGEIQADVRPS